MVAELMPLDLWTLFVEYVFGGFWVAVIGICLVMFIIMGVLGRISIYSVTWYLIMFILAMALGYGFILFNLLITISLVVAFLFSWDRYFRN
jgi:hypothetical protein